MKSSEGCRFNLVNKPQRILHIAQHLYLVIVKRIKTINLSGLNKGFSSKFHGHSQFWHETPEEGQRMHCLKHCKYNNKDKDNSLNSLNDKCYQTSSQKFRQTIYFTCSTWAAMSQKQPKNLSHERWRCSWSLYRNQVVQKHFGWVARTSMIR